MSFKHIALPTALLLAALGAPGGVARAEEPALPSADRPLSDLPRYETPVPDLTPGFFPLLAPPLLGEAALSIVVSARRADDRLDLGGSLVLELPFEGITSRKAKRVDKEKKQREQESDTIAEEERRPPAPTPRAPRRELPVIRPKDARAAVAAARRHRKTDATLDDLDSMASRARYGSLLPTLRLRATRLVDESISLSPTSYDAERTTTRGGASLWLEARASWSLDRLVFASEEVRVTQLTLDYDAKQNKASQSVLGQLFAWQRAVYAIHDATLSIPACVQAWLEVQERAATLDLATGGWFGKWSRGKAGPTPDCVEAFAAP